MEISTVYTCQDTESEFGTEKKNSLVQHNGYMPRQWVFGWIPHVKTTLRVLNIVQRVRIQEDSPTVDDGRRKRPRVVETGPQKMEVDQVPESELPPVPEDDDLNATVIEVMTDVEVLLDGRSVIDVFTVNCARRKRVEVSERK